MFTKILLAVDTSEHSHKAIAATKELATSLGAEVHVLHVRELVTIGRGGLQDLDEVEHERNVPEEVCTELRESGIVATSGRLSSYHGDTGHVIAKAAEERGSDLIVVGSRGHSKIPSILLGSVANKVMHLATCPVLIVR